MKRLAALLLAVALPAFALPSFDEVRRAHRPSDVEWTDRHGTPVQTQRTDERVRRLAWMPLAEVSPALREAIVLGEDRRFWEHSGVDWRALAAAAWANAWNERTRGASTLTMQLAGLLDEELARPAGGRSVVQKIGQAARATELERRWTKAQVLEAWLNLVPLRGDAVGVPAAAWALFGKRPGGLDSVEAALLAALVRAPNAKPEAAVRRACELLKAQRQPCTGLETTAEAAFARRAPPSPGEALAPHFVRHWRAAGGGARTTLDAGLQRVATQALRQQLAELRGRNVEDGAVIVLDNASGDVLAWVGSSGPGSPGEPAPPGASAPLGGTAGLDRPRGHSRASAVDAVLARRQPGSTLKPFVYALALERRLVTAATRIDDAPLELAAGDGLYAPQNYDGGFKGDVSVRTALASSLNVPAVKVGAMVGADDLFARLQRAGLGLKESAGFHGNALALGTSEVTLADLANAYRMLANGGRWSAIAVGTPAAPRRVFDEATAWLVADVLADAPARALTFGFDSPLVTRGWAAVKTGTSKDLRDNWALGFTRRFTVGVWVGNAGGEPMHGVSGTHGAAPVWREVVAHLHAAEPSRAPPPPAALRREGGEFYLAGTGPARAGRASALGITSPRDGSIVVLDPDIPPALQRLVFRGAAGRWSVDGQPVGEGERVVWKPLPGRHRLERKGGGSADAVHFEVRWKR